MYKEDHNHKTTKSNYSPYMKPIKNLPPNIPRLRTTQSAPILGVRDRVHNTRVRHTFKKKYKYKNNYKHNYKHNIYCSNCNGKGHLFKECKKPIRSYGIIAFRILNNKETQDSNSKYPHIQVCLIRRKNTISYEAFIRGKYKLDELPIHLERMTTMEKKRIKLLKWDDLYSQICYHKSSKHAERERKKAKDLYELIDARQVFNDTSSEWDIPEWEFPKGRKYFDETQQECAVREFQEETNIHERYVTLINHTFFETFEGTNKRIYKNQYFLANISLESDEPYIDLNSKNQITEIGDVDWFSIEQSLELIRNYHTHKKNILKDALNVFLSHNIQ